jgi:hypothetical protein
MADRETQQGQTVAEFPQCAYHYGYAHIFFRNKSLWSKDENPIA